MDKPKIAIVAGIIYDVDYFSIFEEFLDEFDIAIYAIDDGLLLPRFNSSLQLKVFSTISDMPGYMRNLEESVAGADLIICMESSRLSSFQALRAGIKFNIPVAVVVTETTAHKYQGYANIMAIQDEIYRSAHFFIADSELSLQKLILEGVAKEKVQVMPVGCCFLDFSYSEQRRDKFRKYIRVPVDELVVLYKGDLIQGSNASVLLEALKALSETESQFARKIKIIFAGNGAFVEDLKYQAVDYGLGRNVMFIHQETQPFLADLYSASDVVFYAEKDAQDVVSIYPRWLLDAMRCRVVPLGVQGAKIEAIIGPQFPLLEPTPNSIAETLLKFVKEPVYLQSAQINAAKLVEERYDNSRLAEGWRAWLRISLAKSSVVHSSDTLKRFMQGRDYPGVLSLADRVIDENIGKPLVLAEAMCRKGEAFLGLGQYESAIEAFNASLENNRDQTSSYLGLGQIALKSQSYGEAYTFFKKALGKDPNSFEACFGMSIIQRKMSMFEDSMYWLLKCLSHSDEVKKQSAMMALTQVVDELGSLSEAVSYLEKGLEAAGDEPSLLLALGRLYMKIGKDDLGRELLKRGLSDF